MFTPVGKRRVPGKQWRSPPGPSGAHILAGWLLDLKFARHDPDMKLVTRRSLFAGQDGFIPATMQDLLQCRVINRAG